MKRSNGSTDLKYTKHSRPNKHNFIYKHIQIKPKITPNTVDIIELSTVVDAKREKYAGQGFFSCLVISW